MLAFYMDQHVPRAVTEGLRRRGVDCTTALDDGRSRSDDVELLERAEALGRVLVTQDKDFLRIAARWQSEKRSFPGILFAAQERVGVQQLIFFVELIGTASEMKNHVEFVPAS